MKDWLNAKEALRVLQRKGTVRLKNGQTVFRLRRDSFGRRCRSVWATYPGMNWHKEGTQGEFLWNNKDLEFEAVKGVEL